MTQTPPRRRPRVDAAIDYGFAALIGVLLFVMILLIAGCAVSSDDLAQLDTAIQEMEVEQRAFRSEAAEGARDTVEEARATGQSAANTAERAAVVAESAEVAAALVGQIATEAPGVVRDAMETGDPDAIVGAIEATSRRLLIARDAQAEVAAGARAVAAGTSQVAEDSLGLADRVQARTNALGEAGDAVEAASVVVRGEYDVLQRKVEQQDYAVAVVTGLINQQAGVDLQWPKYTKAPEPDGPDYGEAAGTASKIGGGLLAMWLLARGGKKAGTAMVRGANTVWGGVAPLIQAKTKADADARAGDSSKPIA